MKICVIAYKFGTEAEIGEHLGTYHYFIETLRRMASLGHGVYVAAPWISFWRRGSTAVDGVKILRYYPPFINRPKLFFVNYLWRWWYIKATQHLVLKLDRKQDLTAICVWQARETGYAVARIAHLLRAPFVFRQITAWQWHLERMKHSRRVQESYAREIYKQAKHIIFVSRAAAHAEKKLGLTEGKIRIMGVAIETDLFKPAGAVKRGKNILFIGRINFAEKGIGVLLEAMPGIISAVPEASLTVVGSGGEWERMSGLIQKLGIGNHVQLAGQKPFTDLPKYLNAADVFVMPSLWVEHFGQVTVEAMSCGLPVVGTNIGGTPEIVGSGSEAGGIIVPPNDPNSLANAAVKLLRDDELRQRMGRAARQRVEQNFSYEVLTRKFLEILEGAERV